MTGLGPIAVGDVVYFTLKRSPTLDADSAALAQIKRGTGLTVLDGTEAATAAWGSLVVDDADAGNVTVSLLPAATKLLAPSGATSRFYDVKVIREAEVDAAALETGTGTITGAITRATS